MPRKRLRFWLLTLGVLAVVLGSFLAALFGVFSKPERIGPANYRKIQIGMKVGEVESLLGKLGDKGECIGDGCRENFMELGWCKVLEDGDVPERPNYRWWFGPAYCIQVGVDPSSQRVCCKFLGSMQEPFPPEPGPWERTKHFLHLDRLF